jgi:hypothetical protein
VQIFFATIGFSGDISYDGMPAPPFTQKIALLSTASLWTSSPGICSHIRPANASKRETR